MAYKKRTTKAYGRPVKDRLRTRLYLLPEAHAYFAIVTAELEKHGSLAPSRTLAVTMGLELLAQQVKRSPANVIKRLAKLSASPTRIAEGDAMFAPGVSLKGSPFLDSLRLTTKPSDPGEAPAATPEPEEVRRQLLDSIPPADASE